LLALPGGGHRLTSVVVGYVCWLPRRWPLGSSFVAARRVSGMALRDWQLAGLAALVEPVIRIDLRDEIIAPVARGAAAHFLVVAWTLPEWIAAYTACEHDHHVEHYRNAVAA
jgi:hypothetical protein